MKRACIAILFALSAPAALAQGGQDITCTASNITLSFGAFDVLAGTTLDAAGSFTVTCVSSASQDRNVTYTAQLAVTPARQMAPPSGADRLAYEVYVDSSRTQPWGDGTGGSQPVVQPNPPLGMNIDVTVYGRIPAGQDVSSGSYSSTVTATIFF